jgi:hypothetical protein
VSQLRFDWLNLSYEPVGPDEKPARFGFTCPNGNGQCFGMLLRPGPHTAEGIPQPPKKTWEWDGNRERPTFSPSIDCKLGGVPCWHGWIRDGKLVDA